MLDLGVIEPTNDSSWSSQPILVAKSEQSGGGTRFAVDYRELNKVTKFDVRPLPRIDDTIANLAGRRYYTSIDLTSGFWQLELHPESKEKTCFTTGEETYQWTVCPFGVLNGSAAFIYDQPDASWLSK